MEIFDILKYELNLSANQRLSREHENCFRYSTF